MSFISLSHRAVATVVLGATALGLTGLTGCTSDSQTIATAEPVSCRPAEMPKAVLRSADGRGEQDGVTLKLVTHDSFAVSDGIFDTFTKKTGIKVEVLSSGDAGQMVSQSILTSGNPVGDVMFGIDNTNLCRGEKAGLFLPYEAKEAKAVPSDLRVAEANLATPIDVGDVCLNYSDTAFPGGKGTPKSLGDLTKAAYKGKFVTENPETSSPGMAFLLATVAEFGKDGWEDYWRDLRANDLKVTSGWSQAYEEDFGAGSGQRSIVTSYASSPVADVLYSDPPRDTPNIGVVPESCFRQIEFAGILRGTKYPQAAAELVDFLLSREFQEDIPLNMFVSPVNPAAKLPEVYAANSIQATDPITMSPAEIEAGRDAWTERWTQIVLR